jgi:hypothetical protein
MKWSSELLLPSKLLHRKFWRTIREKLTTYVPRKSRMLKLFSILQYRMVAGSSETILLLISLWMPFWLVDKCYRARFNIIWWWNLI